VKQKSQKQEKNNEGNCLAYWGGKEENVLDNELSLYRDRGGDVVSRPGGKLLSLYGAISHLRRKLEIDVCN